MKHGHGHRGNTQQRFGRGVSRHPGPKVIFGHVLVLENLLSHGHSTTHIPETGAAVFNWAAIIEEYEGHTWDVPVESSDDLTAEARDQIMGLGYYGKVIVPEHAAMLEASESYKAAAQYEIVRLCVDGTGSEAFDVKEAAKEYILGHMQWATSDTAFHSDYCHYSCSFKMSELDINWEDYQP